MSCLLLTVTLLNVALSRSRVKARSRTPVSPRAGLPDNIRGRGCSEGDLAFLHVHPEETEGAANEIVFDATFPTAGRYRLYLQFRHEGVVRTVEFTVAVPR